MSHTRTVTKLWSVGHGARAIDDLRALLRGGAIEAIADIRRYPTSQRHPQFAGATLAAALRDVGISYLHLPGLGGRRRASHSSLHAALAEPGFRAYADHLASDEFARDLERLRELAAERRTAFMCAETLWWKCHRRILADLLVAAGDEVTHLTRPGESAPHRLWDLARVASDGMLIYDRGALALFPR